MRRDELGKALRETPIPAPAEAERRGLEVVEAAYAQRRPRQRSSLPRLAVAFSAVTLLAALLLSPAGAAVRDWVDDVVTTSTPRPEPMLADIPGGGRLLVQSKQGPWVVQPAGSRRLLGDYAEATWSPRGLFVAAAAGRTLSALEPDGDPRWSVAAPGMVSTPRWSPSGYRIAYRSGAELRVIAGDGSGDRALGGEAAAVAPAWAPDGLPQLAYATPAGKLRIINSENGHVLASALALPGATQLEWGAEGSLILEASPRSLRLRTVHADKLAARPEIRTDLPLPVPPRATVIDAALSPRHGIVTAVLARETSAGRRSTVVLFNRLNQPIREPRRLLNVPGELGEVAWSPDGRRLLIAWPDADQWLFLPVGRGKGRAVAGVSTAFSPGRRAASFPRIEGWCCYR